MRVRLSDGSFVNVNTDDPKAAAAAARRYEANRKSATPRTGLQTAGDFGLDVLDNVIPGWGDEIYAAPGAIKSLVKGEDAGQAFVNGQREFKRSQAQYDKEHPGLAWGSTIGGSAAGLFVPGGNVMRGAKLTSRMLEAAKVGAKWGAVAGAGEGEGLDLGRRASNAVDGAATGFVVGGAIPPAISASVKGGRWARRNIPGVDRLSTQLARVPRAVTAPFRQASNDPPKADQHALRMAGEHMNQGHLIDGMGVNGPAATPDVIQAEVARRNAMNVPAMVGDVTDDMRGLTSWASRGMGPGQRLVRQALDKRKAEEGNRIRQHVLDTIGGTDDPIKWTEDFNRQAKAKVGPLYDAAYQQPMQLTDEIQGIMQTPAFKNAVPEARTNIMNQIDPRTGRPKDPEAMGMRFFPGQPGQGLPPNTPYFQVPGGFVTIDKNLSTEGFDQVVRAMDAQGRAAGEVNPLTGKVRDTTGSVHINGRARDLRSHLMDQNDPYRQAVETFGDDMAMQRAFEQGGEIGDRTGQEINAQRRVMPDMAQDPWRIGAGSAMANEASQYGAKFPTGDTAQHVRKMLGDDVKQKAVSELTGNDGSVRQLQDRLEYEHQGNVNWKGVQGNSRTAQNQQLDQDIAGDMIPPTTLSGWKNAFFDYVAGKAAPKFQQDVKSKIAQIVTASDAQSVDDAIRAIQAQAERDRDFGVLLQKSGIVGSRAYSRALEPQDQANLDDN